MSANPPAKDPSGQRHAVLLVDDHPLVREGLCKVIEREADLWVCGQAEEGGRAYDECVRLRPEIVIVDLSLRGESGLDLIKRLKDLAEPPKILVLSMHDELSYAERALRAGAVGYVMKRETAGNVIKAIRSILLGNVYVSEAVASQMTRRLVGSRSPVLLSPVERLSDRELEVFRRLGHGQSAPRIAVDLHLSLKTVQTHCAHIKEKMGLGNVTELIREAVRWVEMEPRT